MSELYSLKNQFLIATPQLTDTHFSRTIIYMCEHNASGAMGIIINRPLQLKLEDVFSHLNIDTQQSSNAVVYNGGPVQTDRGFVLHSANSQWDSTVKITSTISLTVSKDVLIAMADSKGPDCSLIAIGYSSWGAGQLEQELSENTWLTSPADEDIIFTQPYEKRFDAVSELMGIDLNLLSIEVGHA